MKWTKVKALPETAWAKTSTKATKGKAGSQTTSQPNGMIVGSVLMWPSVYLFPFLDQRGRTPAPRNNNVGPPVLPNSSGVNNKSLGTLPPNLVVNGKGKGKGKEKETVKPSLDLDELVAHTVAMDLGEEEDNQEYYGAGLDLTSAGIVSSPALPPPDHDSIDHSGIGVYVSGVSANPDLVVEDSLWGDPLEDRNKNKDKTKNKKDEEVLLCEYHGKVCSRGICKVYEKQLREQKKKKLQELKESQESQNWRNGTGGPNNGRGGRGGRGVARGRGTLPRGRGGFGRDPEPRSPRDGDFCHTDLFLVSHLSPFFPQKTRPQRGLTISLSLETRGPNPAENPKMTLLGGLTTTLGAQARWDSLRNPLKNPIPAQV